jgi:hypothetical protein
VLSVGAPAATPTGGGGEPAPQPEGGSGRLEVTIAPDDPDAVRDYVFWDARIVVSIASTEGEVLVVPVAALTVGPDQVSQVEVERQPATDDTPAVTEVVEVEVGLTSNGLAEVRPIEAGALVEGDRVVIGVETGERNNEDETSGPTVPDAGDGGDDGDRGDDGSAGDSGDSTTSPLAALFGFDSDPVEQRRLQLAAEEQIASCMRDLGFEYEPVDYSTMTNPEDELQFTDPTAFGEKYGYGIMRSYELYETGSGVAGPEFVDPNQEYVNSLSADEQTAYYNALFGTQFSEPVGTVVGDVPSESVAPPTPEQQGCNGQAYAEVYGQDATNDPEVQEAIGGIYEDLENDPRLDDARKLWATCIGPTFEERGIDPEPDDPNKMWNAIDGLKSEALGLEVVEFDTQAELDEFVNSGEQVYSATYEEGAGGVAYVGTPTELDGAEIDRLTGIEVELWKQDQACQDEAGIAELRRQLELEAVDQLVARFPQLGE